MTAKTLSHEKQQLINNIEQQQEQLITFLKELVSIPSDNPPGDCQKIAEHIFKRLDEFGFENVSINEVEDEKVKATGMIKASNVIGFTTFGNGQGPEITLNSHGDVVPPGLGWTQEPYGGKVLDGKLYGRGAAVSKSDIASYTFAVLALRQIQAKLNGKISLAFTFDEETGGGIGPKWLLEKGLINPDMAICPGFTYSLVNAHNGCLHLEVKLKGKSAHAAEPQYGHDALEAMTGVLSALYEYRKGFTKVKSEVPGIESPSLVVGLISGGINTNVVPDTAVIRLDRRLIPEENPEVAETEIRNVIAEALENYPGVEAEIKQVLLARSFGPVPVDSPLVQSISANWTEIIGGELPVGGSPLYTDARHFAEAGIPVVLFGAGPRTLLEANGHRADEHVKIDDLVKSTKIVALALYDLLHKQI
ncbi:ArgE/DapE family deacylase [Neobacillus ginsengisoli]|uniref:Acetylornithine deacetylase/succinyl-diaminopimelate desuccinylase family protein n=1 Tax=Neobacillus ginsengisoli TaxID=904295 RepID=A0ABT9XVJ2_9BACI|nr:ArgE/DapE family deacylase [Neobacillus ginsengisoli]MDQ0199596.1 acetylornithine deacetylase/succinyl-diaminopimelate desuccinylase family protein [Neobacillus ginsengisoli]